MLLRTLTRHVKDQNWFAVLIDFLIVVVGVFIGIQVANWSQARSDASRIERRLDDVVEDLHADIVEIDGIIQTAKWRNSAIYTALELTGSIEILTELETPDGTVMKIPTPPKFESKLPNTVALAVQWLATLDGNSAAYETLINSGDLHLLQNEEIARNLQNYYARAKEIYDFDRDLQDRSDRMLVEFTRLGMIPGETDMDQLVEMLRNDASLAAAIYLVYGRSFMQMNYMQELSDRAKTLIDEIEASK